MCIQSNIAHMKLGKVKHAIKMYSKTTRVHVINLHPMLKNKHLMDTVNICIMGVILMLFMNNKGFFFINVQV